MSTDAPAPAYRFYVADLGSGEINLGSDQAHHALHVLRLGRGDLVAVFDGAGGSATARIESVGRGDVVLVVEQTPTLSVRPGAVIELVFAIPKGKRVDWLVEKATELGVAVLQPITFERSVAGGKALSAAKRERWIAHCVSAARQCELDFLPELRDIQSLPDYLGACSADLRLVGEVGDGAEGLFEALSAWRPGGTISLLIGPEGDLTDGERASSVQGGFRPIHFGHTILRVETAAIALAAGVIAVCDHLDG